MTIHQVRCLGHKTVPGMDFAGVVEQQGVGAEKFEIGAEVFGTADIAAGAFAEFVVSHLSARRTYAHSHLATRTPCGPRSRVKSPKLTSTTTPT